MFSFLLPCSSMSLLFSEPSRAFPLIQSKCQSLYCNLQDLTQSGPILADLISFPFSLTLPRPFPILYACGLPYGFNALSSTGNESYSVSDIQLSRKMWQFLFFFFRHDRVKHSLFDSARWKEREMVCAGSEQRQREMNLVCPWDWGNHWSIIRL